MEFEVGKNYTVDQGWIECLYGPTLSHGDKIKVLFTLDDRVNAARIRGEEKEIVIFSLKEVHEGSFIESVDK